MNMNWTHAAWTVAAIAALGAAWRWRGWLAAETTLPRWGYLGLLLAAGVSTATAQMASQNADAARGLSSGWFRVAMRWQVVANQHKLNATRWRVAAVVLATENACEVADGDI